MLINSISNLPINFKGQKADVYKVTPAHITAVTDPYGQGYIKRLDKLGLINKAMLARVQNAIQNETERSTAASVDRIINILKYPLYSAEQGDNGYFYQYENPHNYREMVDAYAQGPKQYLTPVFSAERQYVSALENVVNKGNKNDLKRLVEFDNPGAIAKLGHLHISSLDSLEKMSTKKLSVCTPVPGTYGIIKAWNTQESIAFVSHKILQPLHDAIIKLKARLVKDIKTIR